jgi:hypothetical protein
MEHIQFLVDNPEVNGKYAIVSWIYRQTMTEIINAEWHIRQVTPLVITPLFSDHNPKQATALMYNRGNNPVWGPVTNMKKLDPPKAFSGKVWNAQKRNQILEGAITAFVGHLPKPAVVAQFFDWVTEMDLPKWLIVQQ